MPGVAPNELLHIYPAVPASVSQARLAVGEFANELGVSGTELDAICLATSEAVSNVVLHAYPERAGHVEVLAALIGRDLTVLVCDRGRGLCVNHESEGLGLGFALMTEACDGLTITARSGGGLEVQMHFLLDTANRLAARYVRGSVASATSAASPCFSTTT
jgi:serine/threonine-protein kinase RsbW